MPNCHSAETIVYLHHRVVAHARRVRKPTLLKLAGWVFIQQQVLKLRFTLIHFMFNLAYCIWFNPLLHWIILMAHFSIRVSFGWPVCMLLGLISIFLLIRKSKLWLPQAGTAAKDAKWFEGLGSEIPNKCRRTQIHFCQTMRNLLLASFDLGTNRQKRISVAQGESCSQIVCSHNSFSV